MYMYSSLEETSETCISPWQLDCHKEMPLVPEYVDFVIILFSLFNTPRPILICRVGQLLTLFILRLSSDDSMEIGF